MLPKTKMLLELVKRSNGRIGIEHLRDLLSDADKLGRRAFLSAALEVIRTRSKERVRRGKDPLYEMLEALQLRTGYDRKTFIAHMVEVIEARNNQIRTLPKSKQTLPGFLEHYGRYLSAAEVEGIATEVAESHSRAH